MRVVHRPSLGIAACSLALRLQHVGLVWHLGWVHLLHLLHLLHLHLHLQLQLQLAAVALHCKAPFEEVKK